MFEFSFAGLICLALAAVVIYHFAGKKILGWVSAEEAALKVKLATFEHRLSVTEMALNPPTAAPVVPVAVVPPAVPVAPAAAPAAAPVAKA